MTELVSEQAGRARKGEWIRGIGYDDTKMAEKRRLNRDDLDRAAPEHPVIVVHVSGHWAVVNSRALELGNLNRNAKNPEGGSLGRDPETGRLNGLLLEMAMLNLAFESLAVTELVVPPFPRDVLIKALQNAAAFLNSSGITGVGDALCAPSCLSAYLELAVRGLLTLRINMIVPHIFLQHFEKAERMFAHKSFLNAGVIPAAASDHPVGLHSALLGVQCMVTRKSPTGEVIGRNERLRLDEAFKVYTTYAAYASGEEKIKGSLTPGRLADMVVLDKDPWETDPDQIGNIGVDMTIVNGQIVYDVESA